jgi:two-component sensor histidine kinase
MPDIALDIVPDKAQAHGKPSCAGARPQACNPIIEVSPTWPERFMSMRNAHSGSDVRRSVGRAVVAKKARGAKRPSTTLAELKAALAREEELRREKRELLHHQVLLAREFEHRLVNGLQMVVSLLSMQSRAATTPEVASQLQTAADRVAAFGRVHRQLHLLDHQKSVELKQYLQGLCDDLAGLLLRDGSGRAVVVTGTDVKVPSALGIPLGFIVNELITNAAKFARGDITVHVESSADALSLSVADDGPGLPPGFDPAASKGLGMKIIQSLVRQNGGMLNFARGGDGRGTRTTVTFPLPSHAGSGRRGTRSGLV